MVPLDPQLRRLVHDGMVQAVPDRDVEDRVLVGLLARLPPAGPPPERGGEDGPAAPHGDDGGGLAAAAKTSAVAGTKPWLWVVLGAATITGAYALGGRREPARPPAAARADAPAREPARASATPPPSLAPLASPSAPLASPSAEPALLTPASPALEGPPGRVGEARRPKPTTGRPALPEADAPAPATPDAAADALEAEIQQIAAADRALAGGEPRRALALAHDHAKAHPHGQLALERAAIELAARCELGEPGAVEDAAAFLRTHAKAPAAAKVRTRCEGSR